MQQLDGDYFDPASIVCRPVQHPARVSAVLMVQCDAYIQEFMELALSDVGYVVESLPGADSDRVLEAVGRLEPDCVLIDSWCLASSVLLRELVSALTDRPRPIPIVILSLDSSSDQAELRRADEVGSGRNGILRKPFELDALTTVVGEAVRRAIPFDNSEAANGSRTRDLVESLAAGGATDIESSTRREWVTLHSLADHLVQLYWWAPEGVYLVGRYSANGTTLEPLGRFTGRAAAIACALTG